MAKGVKFINQHLRESFPHRSIEAIKGRRRQEMVKDFGLEARPSPAVEVTEEGNLDDLRSAATPSGVAGATALQTNRDESHHDAQVSPPPQAADRLRDSIRQIIERNTAISSFESETLLNIGRAALSKWKLMFRQSKDGWDGSSPRQLCINAARIDGVVLERELRIASRRGRGNLHTCKPSTRRT